MFADPQTVTISGSGLTLQKINQDGYSSEYLLRNATDDRRLRIRNTTYRAKGATVLTDRHNVEFIHTVFATATDPTFIRKVYFVLENQQGDDPAEVVAIAAGLAAWLTASTNAAANKLMNFES